MTGSSPCSPCFQATLGAKRVAITLPRTELSIPVYYILAPAEASSNLSRFDGVKFGHRADQYTDLIDMYKKTRAEGFGDEVKRRIMIGTYVLSHGYYDAYYLQAQKIRRMIADDFQQAFKQCDVIAGPVGRPSCICSKEFITGWLISKALRCARVPIGRLLEAMGRVQQLRFTEVVADQLKADGHVPIETGRQAHAGQPGE